MRGDVGANRVPGGANCPCDCDGYRPDALEIEISALGWYTEPMDFKSLRITFVLLLPLLWVDGVWAFDCLSDGGTSSLKALA